jgi:hypothetical protein
MKRLYKDTLPQDKRGFHLTVLGIKEPTFIDSNEPLEAEKLRDFTFYFGFASVEIKPEQTSLFGKIIDELKTRGVKDDEVELRA